MRKVIVLSFISMDGVMQAPGGPEEDPSGGFAFGGWTVPYFDEAGGEVMAEQMGHPFDLLLGRKTYDIFAGYWPDHDDEIGAPINRARKYVASRSPLTLTWEGAEQLEGDAAEAVAAIRQGDGPELQVHGSGDFIQTLLRADLVDELWLKVFPVVLGGGKRLFADGAVPAAFTLTDSRTTPSGIIAANYERAGDVETGSF